MNRADEPTRDAEAPLDGGASTVPRHAPARSLEGLHGSVAVPHSDAGYWRQFRAFVGPALLVSVGYMDPGNWGTDLDGGANYKYGLLWVVVLSSLMAIVLQVCAARLGVVMGKDLAQACRDHYPAWTRWPNWLGCELAIAACDLAEVLGSAVAINLLFPVIPLSWAVVITAFDVVLLLSLQGLGMRVIEAVILVLVATIGVCYFLELFVLPQTKPQFAEIGHALLTPGFRDRAMVYTAVAIIGATVMPHNLYLHSALVQSRRFQSDERSIRKARTFNTVDSVVALSVAMLINMAIMVLAAMVFFGKQTVTLANGTVVAFGDKPDWLQIGYLTLGHLLGAVGASLLFAVALLASGQSSTITGTLAGQVVMEGFMHWQIRPWLRRLMTRLLAVVPAIVLISIRGASSVLDLLILSQVVLALQLPFAMFPLMHFTSSRRFMGRYANGRFLLIAGWTCFVLITALDLCSLPKLLPDAWAALIGK